MCHGGYERGFDTMVYGLPCRMRQYEMRDLVQYWPVLNHVVM